MAIWSPRILTILAIECASIVINFGLDFLFSIKETRFCVASTAPNKADSRVDSIVRKERYAIRVSVSSDGFGSLHSGLRTEPPSTSSIARHATITPPGVFRR